MAHASYNAAREGKWRYSVAMPTPASAAMPSSVISEFGREPI